MTHDPFGVHGTFATSTDPAVGFYNLPALEAAGVGPISRLPVSVRIVLESLLRNCDGERVTEAQVRQLANWQPTATRTEEIPFVVARVVLQDFTGVPLLCDLAAMREATARLGREALFISRANTYYSCWCLALTPFRINALPHAPGYRLVGWPEL